MPRLAPLAVLATLALGSAMAQAAEPAPKLPVEEVERIVRDYLLREPEIIYQAIQELQRRREVAEAERQKTTIAARKDQIFKSPDDPVLGNPKGDVTLVEFFDYRCGYCRNMVPSLRALLGEDKRLRFVMKEFPILGPDSLVASRAALAAARQGKYQEMHFALLQAPDLGEAAVLDLAKKLGLDPARLAADMQREDVKRVIDNNRELAKALGISGTPSFVIGDTLVPGAVPVTDLAQLIAQQRSAKD